MKSLPLFRNALLADDALVRVDNVGAAVGSELQRQAVIALLLAGLGMVIYITIRFEFRFCRHRHYCASA